MIKKTGHFCSAIFILASSLFTVTKVTFYSYQTDSLYVYTYLANKPDSDVPPSLLFISSLYTRLSHLKLWVLLTAKTFPAGTLNVLYYCFFSPPNYVHMHSKDGNVCMYRKLC